MTGTPKKDSLLPWLPGLYPVSSLPGLISENAASAQMQGGSGRQRTITPFWQTAAVEQSLLRCAFCERKKPIPPDHGPGEMGVVNLLEKLLRGIIVLKNDDLTFRRQFAEGLIKSSCNVFRNLFSWFRVAPLIGDERRIKDDEAGVR